MVYFDPIMHHSAENDKYAFHIFLLVPDTDLSTFTTGRAHTGQLIDYACRLSNNILVISIPFIRYDCVFGIGRENTILYYTFI